MKHFALPVEFVEQVDDLLVHLGSRRVLKVAPAEVRVNVVDALGEIGPEAKTAVTALKKLQVEKDKDVQDAVKEALKKIVGNKADGK